MNNTSTFQRGAADAPVVNNGNSEIVLGGTPRPLEPSRRDKQQAGDALKVNREDWFENRRRIADQRTRAARDANELVADAANYLRQASESLSHGGLATADAFLTLAIASATKAQETIKE